MLNYSEETDRDRMIKEHPRSWSRDPRDGSAYERPQDMVAGVRRGGAE